MINMYPGEEVNARVMKYMLARACKIKADAMAYVRDPESMRGACDYIKQVWRVEAKQSIQEIAESNYNYLNYRARARQGGRLIDPAAVREWALLCSADYVDSYPEAPNYDFQTSENT